LTLCCLKGYLQNFSFELQLLLPISEELQNFSLDSTFPEKVQVFSFGSKLERKVQNFALTPHWLKKYRISAWTPSPLPEKVQYLSFESKLARKVQKFSFKSSLAEKKYRTSAVAPS
jgi:hypothetical protein